MLSLTGSAWKWRNLRTRLTADVKKTQIYVRKQWKVVTMTSSGQSLEQRPLSTEKDTDFRGSGIFSNIGCICKSTTHCHANSSDLGPGVHPVNKQGRSV